MDYFQGVVTEYLRADRAVFVNPECRIQLESGPVHAKGQHWYCDVMAVNFREESVYLCEVTYSKTMHALLNRLRAWQTHWPALRAAIARDCSVPASWKVRSCLFIPEELSDQLNKKLSALFKGNQDTDSMPRPVVKILEKTVLP